MTQARYSVDTVSKGSQVEAYIVRIYENGICAQTVNFPVTNPTASARTLNRACEYARITVKKIMESAK
jgi:hypothetical protein